MLIGVVFALGCTIGNAESQCSDIVRRLSNHCGVNGNGGVCCDYKNYAISNDGGTISIFNVMKRNTHETTIVSYDL